MLADQPPPPDTQIHISGMPVFEGVLGDYMLKDLMLMIPAVALIVIVFLYFTYQSLLLVGLCTAIIILVVVWTLGCMAWSGQPLYVIQCVMPVILMALSVADEIHIFGRYAEECRQGSAPYRTKVLTVMQEMWRPVVLTSITTACGFLALAMTSMRPIQFFGLFTAFGIMCAMLFALFATPAALILFGKREARDVSHRFLDRSLIRTGTILYQKSTWVKGAILMIAVLAVVGMSKVEIQDSWIANFKKTSSVYTDDAALNHWFAGTNVAYIEIDTGVADGIKNPDFLKRLRLFHEGIERIEGVGTSLSVMHVLEKMNQELRGTRSLPDSPDAVAQYLLLLDGSTYEQFWDYTYRRVNLIMFCKRGDFKFGEYLFYPNVKKYAEACLPDCTVSYGGELRLSYHWVKLLQTDQLKSFCTSLVLILLVSSAVLCSVKKGLAVTAPIVLAVAMNYGIMGFSGMYLSVSISIFSAIILGIGIDYAIHLQNKFDVLTRHMTVREAMPAVFLSAGKAIVWNAAVVIAGFMSLLLSRTPPNQKLGLVCSLGMITSLIASFLVVPALFRKK